MKNLENFKVNQISKQESQKINGGFLAPLLVYIKDKAVEYGQSFQGGEQANIGQAAVNGAISALK